MKKYELTNNCIQVGDTKLFQIRALISFGAVQKGDLGGFIEKDDNLSHDDGAWVSDNARVFGDARVSGNAQVWGDAQVSGNARVSGSAWVSGDARVSGNARVSQRMKVHKTSHYLHLIGPTFCITLTHDYINVGCKEFTLKSLKVCKSSSEILDKKQFALLKKQVLGLYKLLPPKKRGAK